MSIDLDVEMERLLLADQHDPFTVLGLHFTDHEPRAAIIRAFQPHAESMRLLAGDNGSVIPEATPMNKTREEGLFEAIIPNCSEPFDYQYEITYFNKSVSIIRDPYRFLPMLTDLDRFLFNNGTHYHLYNKLGAQTSTIDNIAGTIFRLWAPSARRVSIIGNFNSWDGRVHQMRSLDNSGIWELFLPAVGQDEPYKFEIRSRDNTVVQKADPFQFYAELRPKSASIVRSLEDYEWHDNEWLTARPHISPYDKPISIYEVHPGSWRRDPDNPSRFLTYKELAEALIPYVKDMGFTHIELMPIMEHPLDESWGYQVTGYYAVTSRYGTPEEFMYFVDLCHQNDIGVILDWVPSHFPTDGHSLGQFDGTAVYEHADPRQGAHPEWGTLIFNYGRKEVSNFLIANALFWFDKYHIDGLRVDAVASMLYLDYARRDGEWMTNRYGGNENLEAIEFMKHMNTVIYERFPNVMMIAEESTSFYGISKPVDEGGLGFGFKWNMGWMNDTLNYFSKDPVYRKYHQNSLTFSLIYAFSENFILPFSHDEVVHGKGSLLNKMPGDKWQKFANLRLLLFLFWMHPGKKLLFMGCEFGQWSEWYCKRSLDWHLLDAEELHRQTQHFVRELNRLYVASPALWEIDFSSAGFQWLDFKDADNSIIAFARFAKNRQDHLVCLFNFTPTPHHGYRLGVPSSAPYREIFCSDYAEFGGSDTKNPDLKEPIHEPFGEAPFHVIVSVPPLGGIILKPA